jgi:Holliday junction DNA helicase RuvA
MIDFVKGKIVHKSLTSIVVEIGGIGLVLHIPISTYESIGVTGDEVKLLTYVSIKNEELNLFGFATFRERKLFKKLISVSGIGTKIALAILSEMPVDEFENAVINEDMVTLTSIHGIGSKTAKRILFELKDEISEAAFIDPTTPIKKDAVSALVSLGFKASKARMLVEKVLKEKKIETIEELIKETLKCV